MPVFEYTALDGNGDKINSLHEAPNETAIARELKERGLFVVKINQSSKSRQVNVSAFAGSFLVTLKENLQLVSIKDAIAIFQQVSLMLKSGLTLLGALEVCREQNGKAALRNSLARMLDDIQAGTSFSAAIEKEKKFFPPISAQMISAGEMSGELDVVLERLAEQLERRQELKHNLLGAMVYPALVVLITVGVVAFLMTKVIPKFTSLLASRNVTLPATTKLLVDTSAFIKANGITLLAILGVVLIIFIATYLTSIGRRFWDRAFLLVPIIGKTLLLAGMAHFGRTVSLLLKSGVSIMDAIRITSQSLGNRAVAYDFNVIENRILEGQSFSASLSSSLMPRMVREVARVGEMTGSLDSVMDELGNFYEERLRKRVKWMSTIFEPAMILIVGGIVGFVYFAFFQVLFQLSSR